MSHAGEISEDQNVHRNLENGVWVHEYPSEASMLIRIKIQTTDVIF